MEKLDNNISYVLLEFVRVFLYLLLSSLAVLEEVMNNFAV